MDWPRRGHTAETHWGWNGARDFEAPSSVDHVLIFTSKAEVCWLSAIRVLKHLPVWICVSVVEPPGHLLVNLFSFSLLWLTQEQFDFLSPMAHLGPSCLIATVTSWIQIQFPLQPFRPVGGNGSWLCWLKSTTPSLVDFLQACPHHCTQSRTVQCGAWLDWHRPQAWPSKDTPSFQRWESLYCWRWEMELHYCSSSLWPALRNRMELVQ